MNCLVFVIVIWCSWNVTSWKTHHFRQTLDIRKTVKWTNWGGGAWSIVSLKEGDFNWWVPNRQRFWTDLPQFASRDSQQNMAGSRRKGVTIQDRGDWSAEVLIQLRIRVRSLNWICCWRPTPFPQQCSIQQHNFLEQLWYYYEHVWFAYFPHLHLVWM